MKRMIIVGSKGDLGSQLVDMSELAGFETLCVGCEFVNARYDFVFTDEDYVHLCIPASSLCEYGWLKDVPATIILHDSVMDSSSNANKDYFNDRAAIVHMLMNSHKTVVIEDSSKVRNDLIEIFTDMGLHPVCLTLLEHDTIMASSQAPLALLCQIIQPSLKRYSDLGLLTASGEELEKALDARSSTWTPATIQSLLRNPQLHALVDTMKSTLRKFE